MLDSAWTGVRRWILEPGWTLATRRLLLGVRILRRIFRKPDDFEGFVPLDRPSRSIRFLRALGRQRRREGRIAHDLGGLATALYRQGLERHARRFGRGAFDRWRKARAVDRRLRRAADEALKRHAL